MRKAAFALALVFIAGAARASPVLYSPATGPPNVVQGDRSGFWSEPADLNGLIGSSEQILDFGLETELANDFVVTYGQTVQTATWWGGYFAGTPCENITNPGFNLRFYRDAGNVPGELVADLSVTDFGEEYVGCQAGSWCPLYKWYTFPNVSFDTEGRYWFAPQMRNHAFPPQGGRLASAYVRDCGSFFRSDYFGYPDWTPVADVFGVAFDCSQEFDCLICGGSSEVDGPHSERATENASWGAVKALFR